MFLHRFLKLKKYKNNAGLFWIITNKLMYNSHYRPIRVSWTPTKCHVIALTVFNNHDFGFFNILNKSRDLNRDI